MPRKRRFPKRRPPLPPGLPEISHCERARWASDGPLLAEDVLDADQAALYHVWADWDTWAQCYGAVRDQLYAARPWLREASIAEALFLAWSTGCDVERPRTAILAMRAADDPRRLHKAAYRAS